MTQAKFTKAATLALVVATLLIASPAYAATAGRISGGSFRSSSGSYSRSSSVPRSSFSSPSRSSQIYSAPRLNTPRSSYIPPSRTSTNIIVIPDSTQNFHPVAPLNNPSVGEFSNPPNPRDFFVILAFLGVVGVTALLLSGGWNDFVAPWLDNQKQKFRRIAVIRQRVALLSSAKDVQSDLIRLAERGNTGNPAGLRKILRETTLALLRNPEKVVYAWSDKHKASLAGAEAMFDKFSMEERSKASEEVLTNVNGKVTAHKGRDKDKTQENEYILVSVIVAIDKDIEIKSSESAENLKDNLMALGSISPENLKALEIIWQPGDNNDTLSSEELLSLYPELNRV